MVKKEPPKQDPFLERETEKYQTPVPSREFILSVLIEEDKPLKRRALLKYFKISDPELEEGLRRRIKAMVRDGQIMQTPQGYYPITHLETCQGVLVMEREGEAYLHTEKDQTVYISGPTLRGYYDGDEVEAQIIQIDKSGNARGRIVKLLKATRPLVVGRLIKSHSHFEVIPFDRKLSQNITVPKENKADATNGDIVYVEILREEKYKFHVEPVGQVIEVLGDFSSPGIEVKMALRKFGIPHEWPSGVEKESKKFPTKVHYKDERTDLTELPLVTIDGEDAKDFDDAVYCEARAGGWRLWVAIADVSHYVKPGSALDKEARLRGNSTYFPGSVVPMLPEALSNELCSLKPEVPRLCVVCQMNVSSKGVIQRSTFYRAVMRSKARLTYTEVAELLRGNEILREKYEHLLPALESLHELYHALHKQRKLRGAIDFDTIETRILFDQSGKIKSIVPTTRNVAHKMIEESMLAANVCAARFIERNKRGALFRIHERPPADKLKSLREFLAELGLDLPGRKAPSPKDFASLLDSIKTREDRHLIETVMLRSLSQAQYNPKNVGHFGLAYPAYLHFTSPIRRYPDLITHRVIIDILANKKPPQNLDLEKLGLHCSETERRSDEATRDAALALKCHYMQDKVGEHFKGIISGVASFGIFVELKDIYIEGLVHVTSLGNEYFYYDAVKHRMVGERTRTVYRLGDSVEVMVARVDIETKRIDLELTQPAKHKDEKTDKSKKARKSKSAKKNQKKERSRERRRKRHK